MAVELKVRIQPVHRSQTGGRGASSKGAMVLNHSGNVLTVFVTDVIGHTPVKDVKRCDPFDAAAVKELVQGDIIEVGLENFIEMLS